MPPRKARCRVQRLVLAAYETSPAWDPQQMSQVGGICGGMQSTSHTATGTVTANVCPSQGTHSLQVYPALESLRGLRVPAPLHQNCTRITRASELPACVSLEALKGRCCVPHLSTQPLPAKEANTSSYGAPRRQSRAWARRHARSHSASCGWRGVRPSGASSAGLAQRSLGSSVCPLNTYCPLIQACMRRSRPGPSRSVRLQWADTARRSE